MQARALCSLPELPRWAALLMAGGRIMAGCNAGNAAFGATCCAERNGVFAAAAQGHRAFRAVAVLTNGAEPGAPCGICRQVLAEFGSDLDMLCFTPEGAQARYRPSGLLPHAFRLKQAAPVFSCRCAAGRA